MAYHSFVAAGIMLPFAISAGVVPGPEAVAWVVSGSLVLGTVAGLAFIRGLNVIGASRAAMLTYLEPLVAVAVGVWWWGEPVGGLAAIVGVALIVGSGAWVARPRP
jgi:drug/metabolite transporter (DMT)-like permease